MKLLESGHSAGKLFMAFELVPGEDLRTVIDREERLDPQLAVRILQQLLDSLGEAHRAGVLHRDIKPANIRVSSTQDGQVSVKLLDFGLARPTDHGSPGVTATGELIGTPRYMSPEQLRAAPLTPASDIYSLGIVFLEMLVGSAPLQGGRWGDQLQRMMSGHVFSFPELQRMGPELVTLIHRMTAVDPAKRLSSAEAVLAHFSDAPEVAPPSRTRAWAIPVVAFALAAVVVAVLLTGQQQPRVVEKPVDERPTSGLIRTSPPEPAARVPAAAVRKECGPPDVGLRKRDMMISATEQRSVATYVPATFDPSDGPAIVVLLAGGGSGGFVERSEFFHVADRENLVLVVPNPTPDGGSSWMTDEAITEAWRDVEAVREGWCLERAPVFLLGEEAGANGVDQLLALPGVDVAAAVTTGHRWDAEGSKRWKPPHRHVPYLRLVQLRDPAMPPEGGPNEPCGSKEILSLETHNKQLAEHYECRGRPTPRADWRFPKGKCTERKCAATLVTCEIEAGREWPMTGKDNPTDECSGTPATYDEFPYREVVWEFFDEHRPRGCGAAGWRGLRTIEEGLEVWTPTDYDGAEKLPVLMYLSRDSAEVSFSPTTRRELTLKTRFPKLANEHGFILLSPLGPRGWNPGPSAKPIKYSFDVVKRELCVDEDRVFVVGDYHGGRSAYPLLREPWVTASAVYAWLPGKTWSDLMADHPKPMLWITPRHSDRAPINGPSKCANDNQPTFDAWEERWLEQNQCRPNQFDDPTPGVDGGSCRRFSCEAPFWSCRIDGGFHWPGVESPPRSVVATIVAKCPTTENLPTFALEDVIWRFFEEAAQ